MSGHMSCVCVSRVTVALRCVYARWGTCLMCLGLLWHCVVCVRAGARALCVWGYCGTALCVWPRVYMHM